MFYSNSMFVQDRVLVATHKRRRFLKEISASQKICSVSRNSCFNKISLPVEGRIGSTVRKK